MHIPMQVINTTFVSIFFIYSHYETGKPFLTGATFFCPPIVDHLQVNSQMYGRINDYCDTEECKSPLSFPTDSHSLQIILYFDEIECVNPLGSKTKVNV